MVILTEPQQVKEVAKELGIEESEVMNFIMADHESWSACSKHLIHQLYLAATDRISPDREAAMAELKEHIRKGGTLGSLFRLLLLYPKPKEG